MVMLTRSAIGCRNMSVTTLICYCKLRRPWSSYLASTSGSMVACGCDIRAENMAACKPQHNFKRRPVGRLFCFRKLTFTVHMQKAIYRDLAPYVSCRQLRTFDCTDYAVACNYSTDLAELPILCASNHPPIHIPASRHSSVPLHTFPSRSPQ